MPSEDAPAVGRRNSRIGLWLFLIYCLLYAGFMALTAFKFQVLATPVAGVNLAIVYGMGLIVAALVLAIIYMALCDNDEDDAAEGKA
jgi:uncharacterized membrane protein (DUF485 family)